MASAVDKQPAAARLAAVAAARCLPTATSASQNSYTTPGDTTENVPDVMNFGGHNVPEEVCEVLEDLGYVGSYTLLNAAFYGVPQTRERMFLIAYHRSVSNSVRFPEPTHWIDLPRGYEGSRRVALKALSNGGLFSEAHSYVDPPEATRDLPPAVTAEVILPHRIGPALGYGKRRTDDGQEALQA